jgi:hypothetical protein
MYMFEKVGTLLNLTSFKNKFKAQHQKTWHTTGVTATIKEENKHKRKLCNTNLFPQICKQGYGSASSWRWAPDSNGLENDLQIWICAPQPKVWNVLTIWDLSNASWTTFKWQAGVGVNKHKWDQIKREKLTASGNEEDQSQEAPHKEDMVSVLNDPEQVVLDCTLILQGKCLAGMLPVKEFEVVDTIWRQDLTYAATAYQGVNVTQAAYHCLAGGVTELSLTFASHKHFIAACLLLPLWLKHLHSTKVPQYM